MCLSLNICGIFSYYFWCPLNVSAGGQSKQSTEFCTDCGELWGSDTLLAGLSAFRLCPAVPHSAGGRRLGENHMTSRSCAQTLSPTWQPTTRAFKQLMEAERSASHMFGVFSTVILWQWGLLSLGQAGPPATTPFAAWALCWVNFSAGPCLALSLPTTSSSGYLPPTNSAKVSKDLLRCRYSLFSNPQSSSVSKHTWQQTPKPVSVSWNLNTWPAMDLVLC
jgi:hypothetical protein